MLSFEQALEFVLRRAPRLAIEPVTLEDAAGRVLAEPLYAEASLPAFDYSAMDGYAVNAATLSGEAPWRLPVRGESRTGHLAPPYESGSACRIFTGAPLPEGTDSVVMQENAPREGDAIVLVERPIIGENVRRAGEDLGVGELALDAGTRLGPYQLGLAAALDRAALKVSARPRVAIVCTGDELRAPGSPPRPGTIPESNSIVIAALARGAGATVRVAAAAEDDRERTRRQVERALEEVDLLVTVGGVSVGEHDVVRPALEEAGVMLDFWKVAIKPGKPLVLGRRDETVVLGLPGNPVSAQVTFALFGLPLLRAMQGARRVVPQSRPMRLAGTIHQKPGRRGFYRGSMDRDRVVPLDGQASGSVNSMAWADALIIVPEDATLLEADTTVEVLPLAEL